jgi:PAS domain S-box-containing protein
MTTNPMRLETPPAIRKAPVNILLVDDEVRNLDVLESILTSTEYQLVRARTAQEALMNLIEGEFAVIVLDIQMPDTSGIELAHLIKQRRRTQDIPIKDILQGYEVGAVDYLTKPIDSQILKSKIAVFVELFRKTRALAALNSALEIEVAQRQKAELALRRANNELELRVLERMAANEELMSQKEAQTRLFDATLSSITDLAYTFDLEGNWIYANKRLLDIWGKSLSEIVGRSSLELGYPPELARRLKRQVKEVIETRQPVKGETYFTSATGVEDYHEYILSPVFAADGKCGGGLWHDAIDHQAQTSRSGD